MKFSAFGLRGRRPFSGLPDSVFFNDEISPFFEYRSARAFKTSMKAVRRRISIDKEISPDLLQDPKLLAKSEPSSPLVRIIRNYNPQAFSEKYTVYPDLPGVALGRILINQTTKSSRSTCIFNSACIIDPFGNVLLAATASPTEQTPLLDIARRYYSMLNDAGEKGDKHLTHLKHCKIAMFFGPGRNPVGLMEAGALGSFYEGELTTGRRKQLEYVLPGQNVSDLEDMLRNLPPFYSKVVNLNNAIEQTKDNTLKEFCRARAPAT